MSTVLFRGRLCNLRAVMLRAVQEGNRVAYLLPSGARLAMRRQQDDRRVLYIWREEPPKTDAWATKWAAELATFLRHLEMENWIAVEQKGRVVQFAAFMEP